MVVTKEYLLSHFYDLFPFKPWQQVHVEKIADGRYRLSLVEDREPSGPSET